jgi:hypothetical protein
MKRFVGAACAVATLLIADPSFAGGSPRYSPATAQPPPWPTQMPNLNPSTPTIGPSYYNAPYQPPYGTWGHNYEENPAGDLPRREEMNPNTDSVVQGNPVGQGE